VDCQPARQYHPTRCAWKQVKGTDTLWDIDGVVRVAEVTVEATRSDGNLHCLSQYHAQPLAKSWC